MKKLLIISPEISGGGIGTYYRNLIPQLQKRGINVTLALLNQDNNATEYNLACSILSPSFTQNDLNTNFDSFKPFPLVRTNLKTSWGIFEKLKNETFDLIEIAEYPLAFIPWVLFNDQTPVLVKLHGSLGQIEQFERRYSQEYQTSVIRYIEDQCLRFAEGIMSYSQSNQSYWKNRLNREIFYSYPFFRLPPKTSGTPIGNYPLVLGRVQTWKGAEELCQAAELLGDACPRIEWIGGDNYYRDYSVSMSGYLKEKYKTWGSNVIHKGRVPYEEAQQKLAAARFLIVPSLWDTFNFTVIEGMAQGKVVVCSDGAGASEHIIDGENGFAYPAKDIHALAEKIRQANQLNEEERKRIGDNARATVQQVFSSDEPVNKRIAIYEELIRNGPREKTDPDLEWLRNWLSPGTEHLEKFPDVLLDQLPIKELFSYLYKRVLKKLP